MAELAARYTDRRDRTAWGSAHKASTAPMTHTGELQGGINYCFLKNVRAMVNLSDRSAAGGGGVFVTGSR